VNITGIEVIGRNPGVAAIGVPVGEKLPVAVGDTVRVHMTVDYRGMAMDGAVWTAIGWQVGVIIPEFIEVFNSRTPVHFNESLEFVTYEIDCDVPITDISGFLIEFGLYGNILDMYAKIMEVPGPDIFTDICMGAIEVIEVEPPPEYELIEETIYPYAYIYEGPHDGGTFTFKTDLFTPAFWIAGRRAAACEGEVRKSVGRVLEMRVYVDKSPLLWSDWRIEVVTAPARATAGVAMSVGIAWWAVAILAALAIALIIVITWAAKEIAGLFKRKPGLEDVKVAWGTETLIKTIVELFTTRPGLEDVKPAWEKEALVLDIQDAEEYWERALTPVETLEGMSEAELRDYLDKIAEEEVPPEEISPWAIVALVGGLGVLGVGAAVALSAARRE